MASDPGPEDHFATNLKTLRESREMSQEDLADAMSKEGFPFHQTTVYKIETGARRVQLTEALALARILGVPVEQMSQPPGRHLAVLGDLRSLIREATSIRHRRLEPAASDFTDVARALQQLLVSGRDDETNQIVDVQAWQALTNAQRHLTSSEVRDMEFAISQVPAWVKKNGDFPPDWMEMGEISF